MSSLWINLLLVVILTLLRTIKCSDDCENCPNLSGLLYDKTEIKRRFCHHTPQLDFFCYTPESLLTSFPAYIYPNTTRIVIGGQTIRNITRRDFSRIPRLRGIALMYNKIENVGENVFSDLRNLTFLDLSHNNLKSESDIKNILCSLNGCRLGATHRMLIHMRNVSQTITRINHFACLSGPMITLSLDKNSFDLAPMAFSGAFLYHLSLRKFFTHAPDRVSWDIFDGVFCIVSLDLSDNNLITFPSFIKRGQEKIRLYIPCLRNLYLNNNRLYTLEVPFLERLSMPYPGLPNLELLSIAGRRNSMIVPSKLFHEDWNPHLRTLNMSGVKLEVSLKSGEDCPFPGSTTLTELDLSGVEYSYEDAHGYHCLPSLAVLHFSSIEVKLGTLTELMTSAFRNCANLTSLSLRNNDLETLPDDFLKGTHNIKDLDLSDNQLTGWNADVFEPDVRLRFLSLRNNRLTVIESRYIPQGHITLEHNTTLLDLTLNPLTCSCDIYWLTLEMRTGSIALEDANNTICQSPVTLKGRLLEEYMPGPRDCILLAPEYVLLWSMCLVFLFFILLISVSYRYRWHVRYFIFNIKVRMGRYRTLDEEKDYRYDAFVTYHYGCALWIKDVLVPELEEGYGQRLCLHDRDWLAGVDIVENVAASIQESRKIVLVVSNGFARSQWCQVELTMAQSASWEQDKKKIILLKMEDIKEENLTPRLALQLKTQTYITWSEEEPGRRLFFRQLNRALGGRQESYRMETSF